MAATNVLGIIFSNSYDETVPQLTALRTMGSVPVAGRYRLIDFPLSNMVNAGISLVGLITNSNYRSLMDHVGNGKPWDLSRKRQGLVILPPFSSADSGMFKGKVESLYGSMGFIKDSGKDYVLLTDTNMLCNINCESLIKYAAEKNADVTIACTNGVPAKIHNATEYIADGNGKITEIRYIDDFETPVNHSIKTMVVKRTVLEHLLHLASATRVWDFEELFLRNADTLSMYRYDQTGYIKVISDINTYYEANMDLLRPEIRRQIFTQENPVYTKTSDRVPAFYGITAKAKNSLIADGCRIEGEVENCVLFRGVRIAKGAKVKDCIIMQDTVIGENVSLECIITDKDVTIRPSKRLCGTSDYPIYIGKGTTI